MRWLLLIGLPIGVLGVAGLASAATPAYRPTDPSQVVLVVSDATTQARLARLRETVADNTANDDAMVEYVAALLATGRQTGIDRYYGYAEAALRTAPQHSPRLQVLQATILQYRHDFAGAEQALTMALAAAPQDAQARLMRAQVRVQLGQFDAVHQDCVALGNAVDPLTSITCLAQAGSQTNLAHAYARLRAVLLTQSSTPAALGWSAGLAAEYATRLGDDVAAEQWYRRALQWDGDSHYPRIAYADWLLAQGRRVDAQRIAAAGQTSADQLRVTLAQGDVHNEASKQWQLAWTEARLRGERGQLRDQARYEWMVLRDAKLAHRTALDNFTDHRDPEDALLLAGTAAQLGDRVAATQVRQWQAQRRYQDIRLDRYLHDVSGGNVSGRGDGVARR